MLITEEKREKGAISANHYIKYAKAGLYSCRKTVEADPAAGGGRIVFGIILFGFLVAMSTKSFSEWWLSYWVREVKKQPSCTAKFKYVQGDGSGTGNIADNPDLDRFVFIYGMTGVALLVLQVNPGSIKSVLIFGPGRAWIFLYSPNPCSFLLASQRSVQQSKTMSVLVPLH